MLIYTSTYRIIRISVFSLLGFGIYSDREEKVLRVLPLVKFANGAWRRVYSSPLKSMKFTSVWIVIH
jgi:hypothetical protein